MRTAKAGRLCGKYHNLMSWFIYLSLMESELAAFLSGIGRLFQICGPEFAKLFRKISKFGLGMYRVESNEGLKFTW